MVDTRRLVTRLHESAVDELPLLKERLSVVALGEAVDRSLAHRFRDTEPDERAVAAYVGALRGADLGLAVLLGAGDEVAWEHAVLTYRPPLFRAARALVGDDAGGRELADSLWAELYGVGHSRASLEPAAERRSLLRYFHERSTLATWLRSVLAQRHVDVVQSRQRIDSLDAEENGHPEHSLADRLAPHEDHSPDRSRLASLFRHVLEAALASLDPPDRLRLACYYVQQLTLAETGRILGEHEATVSRKLARTRRHLRRAVEDALGVQHRLSAAEIAQCYEYVVDETPLDLREVLEP